MIKSKMSRGERFWYPFITGTVLAGIFIFLFFKILDSVLEQASLARFDLVVFNSLDAIRTPILNDIMTLFTLLGNWEIVILGVIFSCVFFAGRKRWNKVIALIVSPAIGEVFVFIVKNLVQRERPITISQFIIENGFSFPSAHSFVALSFYGLLTYFAFRHARRKRIKLGILIAGIVLILVIGFSRIYLGVHWASDVLASYASGAAWLALVITALEIFNGNENVK